MHNSSLIYIDVIIGIFLIPVGIFYKYFCKIFRYKFHDGEVVVIKFLGAGNLVAINKEISGATVITSYRNSGVLKAIEHVGVIYINDANLSSLFISTLRLIKILVTTKVNCIINLEAESYFAKFLVLISNSNYNYGLSTRFRSIYDKYLYDRILVKSELIDLKSAINYLKSGKVFINTVLNSEYAKLYEEGVKRLHNTNINLIGIYPSCSTTDYLRRMTNYQLLDLCTNLIIINKKFKIYFQSENDPQYILLANKFSGYINVTNTNDFFRSIQQVDLVITIDSLALHVAQYFQKDVICLYGPTSPRNISMNYKVIPIYTPYICSPCTHKYFSRPCKDIAPCMGLNLNIKDIL